MKREHLQFAAVTILTLARAIGATTGSVVNAVLLAVRAGFSDDDVLRSQRAAEIGSAGARREVEGRCHSVVGFHAAPQLRVRAG
jgi:hypothetical protein